MIGSLDAGNRVRGELIGKIGTGNFCKRRHGTP